jgi:Zn-dependent protease with chaperone function
MSRRRGLLIGIVICSILAVAAIYFALAGSSTGLNHGKLGSKISFPEKLLLEDFQRPLDRDITEQLVAFEQTGVSQFIDGNILKPYFDDVQTQRLTVTGVELGPDQFPDRQDLNRIVEDCARILEIPKPRVFVADFPGVNAYTLNMADPIIVVSSSLVRRFDDPGELRFVIGHEMSHIRARHVKWKAVLHAIVESLRNLKLFPSDVAILPFLPLLKWAREAEMSADNAGLICCQDLETAERALVRLALNIENSKIGRINVESFLQQRGTESLSQFSEIMLYWRQLLLEHPFIPDRILQLRKYQESRSYRHLWE